MSISAQSLSFPTLAGELLPRRSLTRDALLVLAFSALNALAAQISIPLPWTPVPITGQTFAVLLTGAVLGSRLGLATLVLYLIEGAVGLPVFAGGTGGWPVLISPSAGYLFAFPLAAGLVGLFAERSWDRRPLTMGLAMIAGSAVIYALGLVWLGGWLGLSGQYPGFYELLTMGMIPFLPGDVLKALLAMALLPGAWRLLRRESGQH